MPDTKTPISERTDESLVRVIAKRMALKPGSWYERTDESGTQTACGRECIAKTAEKTGKSDLVLPV